MGPFLRTRVARGSPKPGINSTEKSRILADKTNHNYCMPFRSKRKVASPQHNPGREISGSSEKRSGIYKLGNTAENQDFLPAERLAVYTFEVDENEPQPSKAKCKRKVQHRKKMGLSAATDEEYIPPLRVKKQMKSGVRRRGTREENPATTSVTRPEVLKDLLEDSELNNSLHELSSEQVSTSCRSKLPFSDKYIPPVTVKRQVRSGVRRRSPRQDKPANTRVIHPENVKDLSEESELNVSLGESASEQVSTSCRKNLQFSNEPIPPVTVKRQVRSGVRRRSTRQDKPANTSVTHPQNVKDLSEESELNVSLDESASEQVSTSRGSNLPFSDEPIPPVTVKRQVRSGVRRRGTSMARPENVKDLSEESELNISLGKSASEQVETSCRSSLPFSPIEQCLSQAGAFVTMRQPRKSKGTHTIWSVEDFTIDNDFGFDEESEDDLHSSKPILSAPFVVSSTPNLKQSFTRMEAKLTKLVQRGAKQPTTKIDFMSVQSSGALSVPATWSAITPLSLPATKATTTLLAVPATQNTTTLLPAPSIEGTTTQNTTTLLPAPSIEGTTTQNTTTLLPEPAATPLPASELSVTSDTSLNAVQAVCGPSPVLFMEKSVMTQHFSKPPRRSYERSVRLHQETYAEEESFSEDKACSRKRVKRSKKTRLREEIVKEWASRLSDEFIEIDKFELCVE